jgi:predicted nucleotidyltransferase
VRRAADDWAMRLLNHRPEVDEIIVFGSFARGTFVPGSDLDVVIVLRESERQFRDRIPEYLPGSFPVGMDLLPYTRTELETTVAAGLMAEVRRSKWSYLRPGATSILHEGS